MSKNNTEYAPKKTGKFIAKIFLGIFIAIIIVVLTAFISAYFFFKNKFGKINYINITSSDIYIDENVEDELSNYRNIALLGIDARKDTFGTGNRSDCIMILSLNQKTNDIK